MATSNLDIPEEMPSFFIVTKVTVDSFTEKSLTQDELDSLGEELSRLLSGQLLTKKAIVSYRSALLNQETWLAAQANK